MDTLVKTLCVVSLVWLAGWSDDGCESPGDPELPDIGYPYHPSPPDGSTVISIEPVLSWYMDGEFDEEEDYRYDVYFGTAEDPPLVMENLDSNEYYTGTLDFETKYYWRIVATEPAPYCRSSEGPLWSFTIYDGIILDEGFEGEFPPTDWWAESAWDLSNQGHTGESSACGTMTDANWNSELFSPAFNIYHDSNGSIDLSFYYKRAFPDRIPKLTIHIRNSDADDIDLFSGWVDNDDWALAEYTVRRSDLGRLFRIYFCTYHYPTSERASVLIDDVLVKDSALK